MARRPSKTSSPAKVAPPPTDFRSALAAMLTAIVVATHFLPSEAVVTDGVNAPLNMLLLVLAMCYFLTATSTSSVPLHFGVADALVALLIGWHTAAGWLVLGQGNSRGALNMTWQWISYGLIAFLLRQLIRTGEQLRAVVAVMIATAVLSAVYGEFQAFVSFPEMRRQLLGNQEQLLKQSDSAYVPGTPEFDLLRARIGSPEPLAAFALTNSLAGFLSPWLIAAAAVATAAWNLPGPRGRFPRWTALAALLIIAVCLTLTRSRAAVLATGVGLAAVGFLYWRSGRTNAEGNAASRWWLPIGIAAVLLTLGGIGAAALDSDVWKGAPASVRYRLEYWHASLRMIAERPIFGVGPGNFQDHYARYKLPQASEMVADPHNFLVEIAATAGMPALFLMLLIVGVIARQKLSDGGELSEAEAAEETRSTSYLPIYIGAAVGVVAAWPCGILVGYPPEILPVFMLALPVAAVVAWGLLPWVREGRLDTNLLAAAALALLVNLLAAGSTGFPGVFLSAWILGALLVSSSRDDAPQLISGRYAGGLLVGVILLGVACYATLYRPVINGRTKLNEATLLHQMGRGPQAEAAYLAAMSADPLSADALRGFTALQWQKWRVQPIDSHKEAAERATDMFLAVVPRSYRAHSQAGDWKLQAYRFSGQDAWLEEALRHYTRACELYPNSSFTHAQTAWLYHLKKDDPAARREAAAALALDDQHDHREQKLSNRKLNDVPAAETKTAEPPDAEESARKVMERLVKEDQP